MLGISDLWNSPIVGAYLIARLAKGYKLHGGNPSAWGRADANPDLPFPLVFPALTILMIPAYSDSLSQSFSSLGEWIVRLLDANHQNLIGGLGPRIREYKDVVLDSIDAAATMNLVAIDTNKGTLVVGKNFAVDSSKIEGAESFRKDLGAKAERLGKWLSQETSAEISRLLEIEFV